MKMKKLSEYLFMGRGSLTVEYRKKYSQVA